MRCPSIVTQTTFPVRKGICMRSFFTNACRRGLLLLLLPLALAGAVRADEVTDWHEHMLVALGNAGVNPVVSSSRCGARFGRGVRCGERNRTPVRTDSRSRRRAPRRFEASRGRAGRLRDSARQVPGASCRPERQARARRWLPLAARRAIPCSAALRGDRQSPRPSSLGAAPMASHRRRLPMSADLNRADGVRPRRRLRLARRRNSPP